MGSEERNLYKAELLCLSAFYTGAVGDVKAPLPHLFCPLALHKDVSCYVSVPRPTQPAFSPPGIILCVCLLVCSCVYHCSFCRELFFPITICVMKTIECVYVMFLIKFVLCFPSVAL